MADVEISDLVELLSRLQLNYTKLAQSWFDIFYNPLPMDIEIEFYNADGTEKQNYVIPNRAKDRTYVIPGEYNPEGKIIANMGALYLDRTCGEIYIKTLANQTNDGWVKLISQSELNKYISHGYGSPEDIVVGTMGQLYVDQTSGYLYMKRSETGSKGWERIDSYPTSLTREEFVVDEETEFIVLNGTCESESVMSIFENGVLIPPSNYTMPYGDNKTIVFKTPIKVPITEKSVQLLVQYFIDIHVAESTVYNALCAMARDLRMYMYGMDYANTPYEEIPEEDRHSVKWFYDNMMAKTVSVEEQLNSIEKTTFEGITTLNETYKTLKDTLDETAGETITYIDGKEAIFNQYVMQVQDAVSDLEDTVPVVTAMRDEVSTMHGQVQANTEYVASIMDNLATIDNLDQFKGEMGELLTEKITEIDDALTTNTNLVNDTRNELLNALTVEISDRSAGDSRLEVLLDNFKDETNSWTTAHENLSAFNNDAGYITASDTPIDANGVYKFNIDKDIDTQSIELAVQKDCTYYTYDLGAFMEDYIGVVYKTDENGDYELDNEGNPIIVDEGHPRGDTSFDFTVVGDVRTSDSLLFTKLKTTAENNNRVFEYTNLVETVRVMFKNDSEYTPDMNWDYRRISWLGEEPLFEAGKSYIVEFVSYDMFNTWKAHVLGLVQPAIDVDTFTSTFEVSVPTFSDDYDEKEDGAEAGVEDLIVAMTIDGREVRADEMYRYDIGQGSMRVTMEIDRKYKGSNITKFYVRTPFMPAFERYSDETLAENPIVLNENGSYTITCSDNVVDDQHQFVVTVRSVTIEDMMEEQGYDMVDVQAKFDFDRQDFDSETGIFDSVYVYDKENPGNTGAVFTFDVADLVMIDPMGEEQESNRLTRVRLISDLIQLNPSMPEICFLSTTSHNVVTDGFVNVLADEEGIW